MRKTGIYDISGAEIMEGDVIKTDLGTECEIFWDEGKQSLMARPIGKFDEATLNLLEQLFGGDALQPVPFQGTNDLIGFSFSYEIIRRA
ncbi:MAG: hypothetical protein ND895_08960 [Pyrinomonadaceae bacterium]|nr:hypothetical protein [Pyrinomonadaceae bacterium]